MYKRQVDYLNVKIGSIEHKLEPQFTDVCTKYDGTEIISLTGLKMSPGYTYTLPNPIKTTCVKKSSFGFNTTDKSVSYSNISLGSYVDFDFDIFDTISGKSVFHKNMRFDEKLGLIEI